MQMTLADITGIAGIVGSIVTILVVIWKLPAERAKMKSEASESVSTAAKALIEPLTNRVIALEQENTALRERIRKLEDALLDREDLREGAQRLVHQLKSISPKTKPVYVPPEE